MANNCEYTMKVVGTKKNIDEFIQVMQADYDYQTKTFKYVRHIGEKVFEAELYEQNSREDKLSEAWIKGYCAWSVSICMFGGEHSYYNDFKKRADCRSTTIPIESKKLNLDIEIYSSEPGCEFQEHYLVRKGKVEIDETTEYLCLYVDEFKTKKEAEENFNEKFSKEEWEGRTDCIERGGFDWEWHI